MKIRMTQSIVGAHFSHNAGDEADFPQAEAVRLIEKGLAVPVAKPKIERATKRTPKKEKRG